MAAELKPCPFCGATENTGLIHECVVVDGFYTVKCFCCGCKIGNHNTKVGAIEAWNRRVDNG